MPANFMRGQFGRPGSNLVTIHSPSGVAFSVNAAAAPNFQAFINAVESRGYTINPDGYRGGSSAGYNYRNIAGSNRLSQHAYGNAIDVNQTGRNSVVGDYPAWIDELAKQFGLVPGSVFGDKGHFEWSGTPLSGQQKRLASFDTSILDTGLESKPMADYTAQNAWSEPAELNQHVGWIEATGGNPTMADLFQAESDPYGTDIAQFGGGTVPTGPNLGAFGQDFSLLPQGESFSDIGSLYGATQYPTTGQVNPNVGGTAIQNFGGDTNLLPQNQSFSDIGNLYGPSSQYFQTNSVTPNYYQTGIPSWNSGASVYNVPQGYGQLGSNYPSGLSSYGGAAFDPFSSSASVFNAPGGDLGMLGTDYIGGTSTATMNQGGNMALGGYESNPVDYETSLYEDPTVGGQPFGFDTSGSFGAQGLPYSPGPGLHHDDYGNIYDADWNWIGHSTGATSQPITSSEAYTGPANPEFTMTGIYNGPVDQQYTLNGVTYPNAQSFNQAFWANMNPSATMNPFGGTAGTAGMPGPGNPSGAPSSAGGGAPMGAYGVPSFNTSGAGFAANKSSSYASNAMIAPDTAGVSAFLTEPIEGGLLKQKFAQPYGPSSFYGSSGLVRTVPYYVSSLGAFPNRDAGTFANMPKTT